MVANGPGIIYRDIPSGGIFETGLHISIESILRFEHHTTLEPRITIHKVISDVKSVYYEAGNLDCDLKYFDSSSFGSPDVVAGFHFLPLAFLILAAMVSSSTKRGHASLLDFWVVHCLLFLFSALIFRTIVGVISSLVG